MVRVPEAAPLSPTTPPPSCQPHEGRPSLAQVRRRYLELHQGHDAPYYLPDESLPSDYQTPPEACVGAMRPGVYRGRGGPCYDAVRCCFCNERQARYNGIKAALLHIGQANIHCVSIPLPGVSTPAEGREAMSRVMRSLRRTSGFTRASLWLHAFGGDPRQGVRPCIEGIISGADANPDVLDPSVASGLAWTLRPYMPFKLGGSWPVEIFSHRDFHPHSAHHVKDLIAAGMEAGRAGIDARRIHAGLYKSPGGELRVRYTDVHQRSRPTHIKDVGGPSPCNDWREADLMRVMHTAATWRNSGRRPVMTRNIMVPDRHLKLVLEAAPWTNYYRIPKAEAMRRRCGPSHHNPRRGARKE